MPRRIKISLAQREQLRAAFLAGYRDDRLSLCCGVEADEVIARIFGESGLPIERRVITPRVTEWAYGALGCAPAGSTSSRSPDRVARYLEKIDALTELSLESDDEHAIALGLGN